MAPGVFFSSRRRHTRCGRDWSSDVCSSDLDEMHRRLAREFARIEAKYPNPISEQEVYDVIKDFKYIVPQGSPMAGIRSEERRVGKECRSRRTADDYRKQCTEVRRPRRRNRP